MKEQRGAIAIPGDRPAGVFTAGAAQRYVNIEGYMVGKKVLILGYRRYRTDHGKTYEFRGCKSSWMCESFVHILTD